YHKEGADYVCAADEFQILKYVWQRPGKKDWPHFACGTETDEVAFDPYGCSKTIKYGQLWNKRVFKFL
ncbi:unnamed protein product, partial [marine sediment metagenome]